MRSICLGLLLTILTQSANADWPTYRGNAARTGHVDGQPGPKSGKVLWVHQDIAHYLASPAVGEKALYLSGLGAFNSAVLQSVSLDVAAKERAVWTKSAPYLKLPVASSPAVSGGLVIFGDGMHQTSGAILHALRAEDGFSLWQYPVPGNLVHLEGAPTIVQGKVFLGAGSAGVLCLDTTKLTLDGQETDLASAKTVLEAKWKQLLAQYEIDKKKDPDFAMRPTEDNLPRTQPKRIWQAGLEKWHVDAAVAVADGKVFAGSAYLDEEKVGDRALFALKAADGGEVWRAPLKHNPWGGATIAGDVAIVGCSNIRFDPKEIPRGQGEVVAIRLADGTEKWKRPVVKGGVLSSVAVSGGLAVFTSTDGKVRAVDLEKGQLKWTYDGKSPFFAGPAVTSDTVYAADLTGVVHAIGLSNGTKQWTLDLANDAAVKSPGAVYGSPVVHGGRLYLATSNLETPGGKKATAIVCIGDK